MIEKKLFNLFRRKILYYDIIDEWLEQQAPYIKESTYAIYFNHIKNHIKPYFNELYINELDNEKIQKFINNKLAYGNIKNETGLSIKTVKELVNVIRLTLQFAVSKNYISEFVLRVKYPNNQKNDRKLLTSHEINLLKEYLEDSIDTTDKGILLMMYTGIRIGELCALKNEDIDIKNGYLHINKTLQRIQKRESGTKIVISTTKSIKSNRIIPIPQLLLSKLDVNDKHFYFLTQNESFIEPRVLRYKFKNIIKKLHISEVTVHSLRHYFATRCIELGFDYNCLSEILGHSSPSTTMNIYVHSKDEYKKECMNKITL